MAVSAEAAAENLLRFAWNDPHTDETPLPVDPVQIARQLGIQVFEADIGADLSGTIVKAAGTDPVILVNRYDSRNRQRFSYAHELGHFVRRSGDDDFEYVDKRGPLATTGEDIEEVYANGFAAALLMPAAVVRREAATGKGPLELARMFHVSADAMSYRMRNLGLA